MISLLPIIDQCAPRAREEYREAVSRGEGMLRLYGLDTPLRLSHFLAQCLHETGGMTVIRENMNYSAKRLVAVFGVGRHTAAVTEEEANILAGNPEEIAERVYGLGNPAKAVELGNTHPGDGYRYRGNGLLQTTGRGSHRRIGNACGVDFENVPELVSDPSHALMPPVAEWTEGNLNYFADQNNIEAITRIVNGGYNGLAERRRWFDTIWRAIAVE